MSSLDQCRLCLQSKELQESHIIPRFVYSWLRETSATGHMRITHTPNLRVQDGVKRKLLCWDCEQLFGGWEKQFADSIFYPYQEESTVPLRYTQFLLKFATSLAWRVLLFHCEESQLSHYSEEQLIQAEKVGEVWREFLRNERSNPGEF